MKTNGKRKKILVRTSITLILSISIFLSSLSITFADASIPIGLYTLDEVIPSQEAIEWVAGMLEQDPNLTVCIYTRTDTTFNETLFFIYVINADVAVYFDITNQNIATSSRYGMAGIITSSTHPETISTVTNQLPGNNSFFMDGAQYWYFNGLNTNSYQPKEFYCSIEFKDNGGDVEPNLDISAYLPRPYYLAAFLSDDHEFVIVDVNFNVDVFPSMVSLWGYNEYGATPYNYVRDEYIGVQFDMGTDGIHSIFKVPLASFRAQYLGKEFIIQSISVIGWDEVGHEEWLSLGWNLSELTPGNYDPPDNNYYYTTYYNEDYHYAEQNGNVVSFGNVDICLYSDNNLDRVYWDKQRTLLCPYPFSICFLPTIYYGPTTTDAKRMYELYDVLVLEFDIVLINCPDDLFDAMYGQGASAEFKALQTNFAMEKWFFNHFRYYDLIPYEYYDNLPTENYVMYDCGCLYTDSFYFKSLAYLLGDSNERLLEFESRLIGEDGAWQKLLDAMKSSYDTDYQYYSDMLTYMNRINYLANLIIREDYLQKYIDELETQSGLLQSIYDKINSISEVLSDVDGEDFDNELGEPWLTFYRFFKSVFVGSLGMLDDFRNTVSVFLDRNSDAVGLDFELDNDYQQYLPLIPNPNNPTPTPIPIPTLFP